MVQNFTAITNTGAKYHHEDGIVRIESSQGYVYSIKPAKLVSFRKDDPNIATEDGKINWEYLNTLPNSEPVIGEHYLVSGFRDWRISTPIVEVALQGEPS